MPNRIQPLCDRLQRMPIGSIQPPRPKRGWLQSREIEGKSPTPTSRAVTGCFCGIFFFSPQFPSFSSSHESRHGCAISLSALAGPRICRRSEEHTSELQSRLHLVCRLLLDKKKRTISHPTHYRLGCKS